MFSVYNILFSLLCQTMPRRSSRRNRPPRFDAQAMSLGDLQALPKKSLVLLASTWNLVTTGTKAQIAQRVFENGLQHANPQDHPRSELHVNVNNSPSNSSTLSPVENINQPLSSGQLNQLRQLITEAINSDNRGPALGNPNVVGPLLSPVTTQAEHQHLTPATSRETNQDGSSPSVALGTRPCQ